MRFIFALLALSASPAFAAGYTCLSVDRDTQVIISVEPQTGVAKQMVFIDPELSKRSQVSAVFSAEDGILTTEDTPQGTLFKAAVTSALPHPGKHLGGTRIGLLSKVTFEVQTLVESAKILSVTDGTMYAAQATYLKKSGEVLTQDFDCALFLSDDAPDIDL